MGPRVYDARIRPSGENNTDAATLVTVNLFVRSFSKIDDVKMVSSGWMARSGMTRTLSIMSHPITFNYGNTQNSLIDVRNASNGLLWADSITIGMAFYYVYTD